MLLNTTVPVGRGWVFPVHGWLGKKDTMQQLMQASGIVDDPVPIESVSQY
jgi:hypothetical protein